MTALNKKQFTLVRSGKISTLYLVQQKYRKSDVNCFSSWATSIWFDIDLMKVFVSNLQSYLFTYHPSNSVGIQHLNNLRIWALVFLVSGLHFLVHQDLLAPNFLYH